MNERTQQPLSVSLVMDPSMHDALRADERIALEVDSYVIDSAPMAELANTALRQSIERIAVIKEWKGGFVAPARQIIANAEALFDPAIAARQSFVAGIRGKLSAWTMEQQRLADEARRKAAEEERRVRQEAEQKAAAERARAEQVAAEQRRQAEAAEAARQKALAEGNAREAAKHAAAAAKLDEKAHATLANAEVKANETVMAAEAAIATAAPVIAAPLAPKGFGMRDNWKGEMLPGHAEADVVRAIVAAIAGVPADALVRPDLLPLLDLNTSNADKLAKALKKAFNVPGMQAVNRQTSVSRAA